MRLLEEFELFDEKIANIFNILSNLIDLSDDIVDVKIFFISLKLFLDFDRIKNLRNI